MRVLVVSAPLLGHLLPLIPLAAALRDAGHQVLLAAGGDALRADTAGVPVRDVGAGVRFGRIAARVMLGNPLLARRELAGRGGTAAVGQLFGGVNERLADPVVALAEQWRPDLVVHEPLAVAGALAAARLGVPTVLQENSLWDGPELIAATAAGARMRRALGRHGVAALPPPAATLTIAPPSLVGARAGRPMRAVAHRSAGAVPDWLGRPGARPRVLVSRSTVAGPGGGDPTARVVAAAAGVDAEIVLVRPPDRVTAKALPPNVRTVGWVPLAAVLPYATVFVHHAGAGSALGALAAGVPQLAVPGPGDRRRNAELVARRGAGLAVAPGDITAEVLRMLLTDATLRAAAAEVRAEMAAMPEPAELVDELIALT